jgi:MFS superfamily sulfate permease-like transporter
MSRQRGYERVKTSDADSDGGREREPHMMSPPAPSRVTQYYNESHLMEQFQEMPLSQGEMRWGFRELLTGAGGRVSALRCQQVKDCALTALFVLKWLPGYDVAENLAPDMIAGLTVGVVLVAQGVAYGLLAGLPAIYGLYASIPPALLYSMLGTSRQMHIGPFALVSLLVAEGVQGGTGLDPETNTEEYIQACMTMSLMVSVVYLAMWALRLGFIVEILSDPTMSGMTTAAAFLICTSQMRHFFGLHGVARGTFIDTWSSIIPKLPGSNPICVAIGVSSLVIQVVINRLNKRLKLKVPVPEQLIVVIVMTALVSVFGLDQDGECFVGSSLVEVATSQKECAALNATWKQDVTVFGEVEPGLPSFSPPDTSHAAEMVEGSLVVAAVSIALCIATAKTFAAKNGYEIDTNQELLALGVANLCGGFFQVRRPLRPFRRPF